MKRLCTDCIHCSYILDCRWGHRKLKKTYTKKREDFTMEKKSFGWVLYDTQGRRYCGSRYGEPCVNDIKDAYMYKTRKDARRIHMIGVDRILKVSLDCNGRPVAVVGRG